jgi:hypothetical protein
MPLKLNVGLSRKLGQPDYGSLGASCHIEVELDGALLQNDLESFHRHVKNAFIACRQAVNEELARNQGACLARSRTAATTSDGANANGHCGAAQRASKKQLDYAQQLAGSIEGLGARRLEVLTDKMYGKPFADLSGLDASGLIDVLKDLKAGKLSFADVQNSTAA